MICITTRKTLYVCAGPWSCLHVKNCVVLGYHYDLYLVAGKCRGHPLGCLWRINVTVYWLQCDERAVARMVLLYVVPSNSPGCSSMGWLLIPPSREVRSRHAATPRVHGPLEVQPHAASAAEVCSRRMAILPSPRPCRPFPSCFVAASLRKCASPQFLVLRWWAWGLTPGE